MDDQLAYGALGLKPGAGPEVVKAAYRALALKYHPDANLGGDSKFANDKMASINEAYEFLTLRWSRSDAQSHIETQCPKCMRNVSASPGDRLRCVVCRAEFEIDSAGAIVWWTFSDAPSQREGPVAPDVASQDSPSYAERAVVSFFGGLWYAVSAVVLWTVLEPLGWFERRFTFRMPTLGEMWGATTDYQTVIVAMCAFAVAVVILWFRGPEETQGQD